MAAFKHFYVVALASKLAALLLLAGCCGNGHCRYEPDQVVAEMSPKATWDPAQAVSVFLEKIKAKKYEEAYQMTVPSGVGGVDPVKGPNHLRNIFETDPYALDFVACSWIEPGYTMVSPRKAPTYASVGLHFKRTYYLVKTFELTPKDFQIVVRRTSTDDPWKIDLDAMTKTLNQAVPKMLGKTPENEAEPAAVKK